MNNKLAIISGIAIALIGGPQAEASVTYNPNGLDYDAAQAYGGWNWTNGDPGYSANLPARWVAFVENSGGIAGNEVINSTDAGFLLGVGARAYKDGNTNWAHNADFGLFHLEHAATVTLTINSDNSELRPGFGLWSGWATGGSRHAPFLANGAINPMAENPLGSGLGLVDTDAWTASSTQGPTASATLTRFLNAGDYTVIIGGYDGTVPGPYLGYSFTINTAPVPLPAGSGLFTIGMALIGYANRRKRK